jgi:hypothetical protein
MRGIKRTVEIEAIARLSPTMQFAALHEFGCGTNPVDLAGLTNKIRAVSIPRQSRGL